jgi:hypothetical protein
MECKCYVSRLSREAQFCLHYGAHNPACPVYRESRDPVDRKYDNLYRENHAYYLEEKAK